jgi:hypothetical protein
MNSFFGRLTLFLLIGFSHLEMSLALNHQIDQRYSTGNGLIYDCKEKTWVCVDEGNFKVCHEKYLKQQSLEKIFYDCLAEEMYPSYSECRKEQMNSLRNNFDFLCYRSDQRRRFIEFQ